MLTPTLTHFDPSRAVILKNVTCVYCATDLKKVSPTKEHVIARRFVPKGFLQTSWNLIVQACEQCNAKKSLLENDISAITLFTTLWQGQDDASAAHINEVARKASKSLSQMTGKPVAQSEQQFSIELQPTAGLTMTFNMRAPPQIHEDRLFELARLQIAGFFYFLTFNWQTRRGGFWRGSFFPIIEAQRSNWGNVAHRAFMVQVVGWEPRLCVWTAQEYFGVMIRKHPTEPCWSWALEWNKQYRVVGLFGDQAVCKSIISKLPHPKLERAELEGGGWFAAVLDVGLEEEDDILFAWKTA